MPKDKDTSENKSSISEATSYREMAEFWDERSLADYWNATEPAEFEVSLESEDFYYKVDPNLAHQVNRLARQRETTTEDLINSWIREKLQGEIA